MAAWNVASQHEASSKQTFSEPDGPSIFRALSNTQTNLPHTTRQSFRSLDRSLKAFLRSSNLPGLEYRLRIAGYNTLSDLLDADEETLCAHGFTPLMARRLLGALTDYIIRQLDKSEGIQLPFQLVRKGQKINSDPTEKMKAMPTFGKQNVKRHRYLEPAKMAKKRSAGSKGAKVINQKKPVSYVRLMSEEHLPNEPIFPNDVILPEAFAGTEDQASGRQPSEDTPTPQETVTPSPETAPSLEVTSHGDAGFAIPSAEMAPSLETAARDDPIAVAGSVSAAQSRGSVRRSIPVFQEFFLPDQVDMGERWVSSEEMGRRLKRCSSVPADYRFQGLHTTPLQSWCMMVRCYSCPSSLAVPPSQMESTFIKLTTSQEVPVIVSTLEGLCSSCKNSEDTRKELRERGGMEVIMDLLVSLCTNPKIVEYCFKLIKYLTREVLLEGVVPAEIVPAVLQGMDCHPFSEKILTQGCLALGNIGRAAPSQCEQLLASRTLSSLAHLMETFPSSLPLQVSAISALAVGLGCWPQGRLSLLEEHGTLLDLVLVAIRSHPDHVQLQEYACSFMALLMAEVAVEMESGVVQLMAEHVCIAMATHGREAPVALWAAKALASASSNAALGDSKLAGRCCDLLAEALRGFPSDEQVWTWSLFALLQLVTRNSSTRSDLIRGGVVTLLKTPPHDLPDYGVQYLEQLLTTLHE